MFSSAYGQDYIDYYQLCNEADKEANFGNEALALTKLEKAFELVDYIHAEKYELASNLAVSNRNFSKGYLYAKRAIQNGSTTQFWKGKNFRKFRSTSYFHTLKDSLETWEQDHLKTLNITYKKLIDSLFYVDQRVIRKNKRIKGDYLIDADKLPHNLYDLDSIILQTLIREMETHGFPSEQRIGRSGYEKALIIIHHNFRLEQNEKYHPIAIRAVQQGEYWPSDFAGMYEQYHMASKGQTYFTTFDKNLSEDNLRRINKNRIKFGLKDLSAFSLRRRGLSMKALW